MGCGGSKIEEEDTVMRCKERRRLAKHLLTCRAELAAAQFAYLRSLRNTGATLRQFAEVELMPHYCCNPPPLSPTLPPPSTPPSPPPQPPPPPPNFSPSHENTTADDRSPIAERLNLDEFDTRPWGPWDSFGSPSGNKLFDEVREMGKVVAEDDNWAETSSDFVEELGDDTAVVVAWRRKNSIVGIVREIDEYLLKAAAGGRDVAALLESGREQCRPWELEGRKGDL